MVGRGSQRRRRVVGQRDGHRPPAPPPGGSHGRCRAAGARCRAPQGAFDVYPDLGPLRAALARRGVATGAALAERLLADHGVGVLPGGAFGDDPAALRLRATASLLYGRTDDERWAALHSPDPVGLPWIAAALDHVRAALASLVS